MDMGDIAMDEDVPSKYFEIASCISGEGTRTILNDGGALARWRDFHPVTISSSGS